MTKGLKTRIGILGGGQLGKMLFEAGSPLNVEYVFLEESEGCPAGLVVENQVVGSLQDADKIEETFQKADVLSYEIEHVNAQKLHSIESNGGLVIPTASVLSIIQDKGLQKEFYTENGISTLPYKISSSAELKKTIDGWPDESFVLKHRKGGYDGKGVQILSKTTFADLFESDNDSIKDDSGYVIEKLAEKVIEISVIVAVGQDNSYATYEPCEMVFDPESNLMDYLIVPCNQEETTINKAKDLALAAVKAFDSPGVFAVELFVLDGAVYVNEIAPRPHNSGHHTIESTDCSQYEQLNRILMGLPLGSTRLINQSVSCNIVGPADLFGKYELENLNQVLALPGVFIHMYGKKETKPNRKLGHFTIIGENTKECLEKMSLVKNHLKIKSA